MLKLRSLVLLMTFTVSLCGCGTDYIVVRKGDIMTLRKPVKAEVLGPNAKGEIVPGTVTLPAGSGVNTDAKVEERP